MRNITTKVVVAALIKLFSTFGLPKEVKTDQGSNFTANLFAQVLKTLSIANRVSSAYHPESQGALERWHQTLKSMLRKYCMDTKNNWEEGVPFVLFAAREVVQESTGFSPAELVFGHTVRGPLKILKTKLPIGTSSLTACHLSALNSATELSPLPLHAAPASDSLSISTTYIRSHRDALSILSY